MNLPEKQSVTFHFRTAALIALFVSTSVARVAAQDQSEAAAAGFDFRYVPQNAMLMVAVRPAAMAKNERLQPLAPLADMVLQEFRVKLKVKPEECEQATFVFVMAPPMMTDPVLVLQCNRDLPQLKLPPGEPAQRRSRRVIHYTPDARTLIVGREQTVRGFAALVEKPSEQPDWAGRIDQSSYFAVAADTQLFRQMIGMQMGRGMSFPILAFEPLWSDTKTVVFNAKAGDQLEGRLTAFCTDGDGAGRVARTIEAVAILIENMMDGAKRNMPIPADAAAIADSSLGLAKAVLSSRKTEVQKEVVTVRMATAIEAADRFIVDLIPILDMERQRAIQSRRKNSLKQIALALHNYHDAYKKFPPSVLTAADGKTKYSWRVAILPFLDHQVLYQQYKMDEPWNSKANLAVMRQMPEVYRHSKDGDDSFKTAYYAIVGERTGFGRAEEGIAIRSFTDGTSNTLMVVESKQGIPWTKPSDLAFEEDGALPGLGGFEKEGFFAAFADGSVQLIPSDYDEASLRLLIMRNDGKQVRRPQPRF